jgi:hypothetical protein
VRGAGVTYDHVFPIEIEQAGGFVQKLQIGYNTGENVYAAAQTFIVSRPSANPPHHPRDKLLYSLSFPLLSEI